MKKKYFILRLDLGSKLAINKVEKDIFILVVTVLTLYKRLLIRSLKKQKLVITIFVTSGGKKCLFMHCYMVKNHREDTYRTVTLNLFIVL